MPWFILGNKSKHISTVNPFSLFLMPILWFLIICHWILEEMFQAIWSFFPVALMIFVCTIGDYPITKFSKFIKTIQKKHLPSLATPLGYFHLPSSHPLSPLPTLPFPIRKLRFRWLSLMPKLSTSERKKTLPFWSMANAIPTLLLLHKTNVFSLKSPLSPGTT